MSTVILESVTLKSGSHASRDEGVCAMELVAWMADEPHSDSPACTSPVLAAFVRAWNDVIPDDDTRTRLLKPILPRLIGTVGSPAVEQRRADLALDWCVRVSTPAWLDLANLTEDAAALRSLPPLLDRATVLAAHAPLKRARERATAAWAARDAAWAAARDAARDAAWDAAWAAAGDAARDAVWDAAWAAARDVLAPTVTQLQESAIVLFSAMIHPETMP